MPIGTSRSSHESQNSLFFESYNFAVNEIHDRAVDIAMAVRMQNSAEKNSQKLDRGTTRGIRGSLGDTSEQFMSLEFEVLPGSRIASGYFQRAITEPCTFMEMKYKIL